MSVADELTRLVELRDRGDLTPEEFVSAKTRLLSAPVAATSGDDGAMLLYQAVTVGQRRAVWLLVVVAALFGAMALWSVGRYADLRGQIDAVKDSALVDRFGVRIPDPRPTIERAELRLRATAFGGLAVVSGLVTVGATVSALLVRPPKDLRAPKASSTTVSRPRAGPTGRTSA
jgi:Short C-terminal domain